MTELTPGCIVQELDNDKDVNIDIPLKMSVLMPLHDQWIIKLHNHFALAVGREIISNKWKAPFIMEALSKDIKGLEP